MRPPAPGALGAFVAGAPALDQGDQDEADQGHRQQHDRDRGGAGFVALFDLLADQDRGDDGVLFAAREEQHRAVLAERPGEGEGDAGGEAGEEVGEDDAAEDRRAAGAERGGRLLHVAVHLDQQRLHRADDEGEGDEAERDDDRRARVSAMSIPTGLFLPQSSIRIRLATIVGSAKGRSMIALMIDLPGKLSRTRSQATIVPKTALIATTISEQTRISSSELFAAGLVTWSQKWPSPSLSDWSSERRERQQDDQAQPEDDVASAEARADPGQAELPCPGRCDWCLCGVGLHRSAGGRRETPSSSSIFATEPSSSSKNSSLTLLQPPNLAILNRPFSGSGNSFGSTSFGLTGR